MNDEKMLERIRNLLAMSKDTSSPNEAAIAARRARSLMDKYQVSELDLTTEEEILGESQFDAETKTNVGWVNILSAACAKYNDCRCGYRKIYGRGIVFSFQGLLADSACAVILMRYLKEQAMTQAQRETGRANRSAYRMGFASGVSRQVEEFMKDREKLQMSDGKSLVVCKKALVEERFGKISWAKARPSTTGDRDSYDAGYHAGKNASLNRQVSGGERRQLTG